MNRRDMLKSLAVVPFVRPEKPVGYVSVYDIEEFVADPQANVGMLPIIHRLCLYDDLGVQIPRARRLDLDTMTAEQVVNIVKLPESGEINIVTRTIPVARVTFTVVPGEDIPPHHPNLEMVWLDLEGPYSV